MVEVDEDMQVDDGKVPGEDDEPDLGGDYDDE